MNDTINQRRRTWFATCKTLGLTEDDQLAIAESFIPENCPIKYKPDGAVSRRAIFERVTVWNSAYGHLSKMQKNRQRNHQRPDGSKGGRATKAQINYAIGLARTLGWAAQGDDLLMFRLAKFSARQCGLKPEARACPLEWLSASQISLVIEGLKKMVARQTNPTNV